MPKLKYSATCANNSDRAFIFSDSFCAMSYNLRLHTHAADTSIADWVYNLL